MSGKRNKECRKDAIFLKGMALARKDEAMRKAAPALYAALKDLLAEYKDAMTDRQTYGSMTPWTGEFKHHNAQQEDL